MTDDQLMTMLKTPDRARTRGRPKPGEDPAQWVRMNLCFVLSREDDARLRKVVDLTGLPIAAILRKSMSLAGVFEEVDPPKPVA